MTLLAPGSRLGPYEVASPIGAGGMGEVYVAKDTRLDRTVAVKVLPEAFADDPERRERFEREARAVSSLNHPHICTLHDVGEHEGIHFLVMEYVEGETLADRLTRGALPFEQALAHAAQIADALDKAHRAGIVHRDLKPGNVMLTKAGIKLLDFGLAKTREEPVASSEDSEPPTRNKPLTGGGTILGTVQYMAPEQLEGKDVDSRADLFALGAILFEMVTGRKAFEGTSQASLISAIMSAEPPPVSELQAVSPPELDRLVKRCLAKDPDDRWHSAHDLAAELGWIAGGASAERSGAAPSSRTVLLLLPAMILGALGAWLIVPAGDESHSLGTFDIALPRDEPLRSDKLAVGISRDGSRIAFATTRQLYVRARDTAVASPIPSSEGGCCPFFSPDGEWLGFFTGSELKKVSLRGGTPLSVADVANGMKASWRPDGNIFYGRGDTGGIFRVSASGGRVDAVTSRVESGFDHGWPELLPGGNALLLWARSENAIETQQIIVQSLSTAESTVLVDGGVKPEYLPTGYLVYAYDSTLWAAALDVERLELLGEPFPVTEGVASLGRGGAQFDISDDGTLVYAPGGRAARRLLWLDKDGNTSPAAHVPDAFVFLRISPDGRRIAASLHPVGESHDIWIYDVNRSTRTRLTTTSHNNTPVWTPDGSRVTFASQRMGSDDIYWKPIDGTAEAEPLLVTEGTQYPSSWHPDGSVLAYETRDPATGRDIGLLFGDGKTRSWLATPADEFLASFSPDGRVVAYASNESGREEVYVRSYPDAGSRTVVSTDGGSEPVWSPSGQKLFYRSLDGAVILAAEVNSAPTLTVGRPEVVLEWEYYSGNRFAPSFDVAPDGERLLVIEAEPGPARIHVVLNWGDEARRLDPNEKRD